MASNTAPPALAPVQDRYDVHCRQRRLDHDTHSREIHPRPPSGDDDDTVDPYRPLSGPALVIPWALCPSPRGGTR